MPPGLGGHGVGLCQAENTQGGENTETVIPSQTKNQTAEAKCRAGGKKKEGHSIQIKIWEVENISMRTREELYKK